ncbi:hypothetical protein OG349_31405 [Streptomyces sp. NBC_01317]|uniref:hypothetical protein n=1 Tax=Streptomyces sp. NBC_01317 TaxID=2903822 RepID=UPI002E11DF01|nr:hypothetical protein OG349_31405 [Streptomyces sp. NBC_01317]
MTRARTRLAHGAATLAVTGALMCGTGTASAAPSVQAAACGTTLASWTGAEDAASFELKQDYTTENGVYPRTFTLELKQGAVTGKLFMEKGAKTFPLEESKYNSRNVHKNTLELNVLVKAEDDEFPEFLPLAATECDANGQVTKAYMTHQDGNGHAVRTS